MNCEVCGELITMSSQGGYLFSGRPICSECNRALRLIETVPGITHMKDESVVFGLKPYRRVLRENGLLHKYETIIDWLLKHHVTPFANMKGKLSALGIHGSLRSEWMWQVWHERTINEPKIWELIVEDIRKLQRERPPHPHEK